MSEVGSPLPIKNGISPNKIWLPEGSWSTVFDFFQQRFPQLTADDCRERFERNEVCTSDGKVLRIDSGYCPGVHLYFYREVKNELIIPFREKILYEDDNIVVVDKPHFLAVAPSGQYLEQTLLVRLRRALGNNEIELCHRLDRETAGVVLLTKKQEVRAIYNSLFSERKITKIYHARAAKSDAIFPIVKKSRLVKGEPYMRMREAKGVSNTESVISVLHHEQKTNLYQLEPTTGKKHQLRVHMAALKIPIVNDPLYPKFQPKESSDFSSPLQLLAKTLKFVDPIDGRPKKFESNQSL